MRKFGWYWVRWSGSSIKMPFEPLEWIDDGNGGQWSGSNGWGGGDEQFDYISSKPIQPPEDIDA
jgi:hypothetical protein